MAIDWNCASLFKFCVVHLPVKLAIRTEFNFGHACPKKEIREKLINEVFGTLVTLPQQSKIKKTSVILVYVHIYILYGHIKKPK